MLRPINLSIMPVMNDALTPTPYELIGRETGVRKLVERFYQIMDEDPDVYGIRQLHPQDLTQSIEKLFKFLSGWLGGPQLYIEEYGHPRLRARHLPFPIGPKERDQWLKCMYQAMEDLKIDAKVQIHLKQAFSQTANHMQNTRPDFTQ